MKAAGGVSRYGQVQRLQVLGELTLQYHAVPVDDPSVDPNCTRRLGALLMGT